MPRHVERRVFAFPQEEIFDLVADVEAYPEFLPWCLGVRVTDRSETSLDADMLIGFKMFREKWGSHVILDRESFKIIVRYTHGPFRHLENSWRFLAHKGGCEVDFFLDFEFRSRILEKAIGNLFADAVYRMVVAFEVRANQLYKQEQLS